MRGKTLIAFLCAALAWAIPAGSATDGGLPEKIVLSVPLDGTVNPFSADFIQTAIAAAEEQKAEAVLLVIDTPGGLLNSTKEIVKSILNSPVPVVAYVSPAGATATSAGAFIFLASHIAAMAPGTSVGAAHPVAGSGKEVEGKGGEKVVNFASSYIESIARERGRNSKWAVKAVKESSSVTWKYAVKNNIADFSAPDAAALLEMIDGTKVSIGNGTRKLSTSGATIITHRMTARQRMGNILGSPDIAYLLLSLGSLGILMEIYNPGSIFPGVVGIISLMLAFASLQVLPFSYAGLGLIVVGAALMMAEFFVTSYGLLALAGTVSLIAGGVLLFDPAQTGGLSVNFRTLAAVGGTFAAILGFVVVAAARSPKVPYLGETVPAGGREGVVVDWQQGGGIVQVGGEYWKAESAGPPLSKGDHVKVSGKADGLKLKVERKTQKSGGKQ